MDHWARQWRAQQRGGTVDLTSLIPSEFWNRCDDWGVLKSGRQMLYLGSCPGALNRLAAGEVKFARTSASERSFGLDPSAVRPPNERVQRTRDLAIARVRSLPSVARRSPLLRRTLGSCILEVRRWQPGSG